MLYILQNNYSKLLKKIFDNIIVYIYVIVPLMAEVAQIER